MSEPVASHRERQDEHDERGETLIELLVSMAVMGVAVTAILGALLVAVDASSMNRRQGEAQNYLRSWAEAVSGVTDADYRDCDATGSASVYKSLAPPAPDGLAASVGTVTFWNGTGFVGGCTSQGLQKVRLTVNVTASLWPGFAQSLDVVVRRPCATC